MQECFFIRKYTLFNLYYVYLPSLRTFSLIACQRFCGHYFSMHHRHWDVVSFLIWTITTAQKPPIFRFQFLPFSELSSGGHMFPSPALFCVRVTIPPFLDRWKIPAQVAGLLRKSRGCFVKYRFSIVGSNVHWSWLLHDCHCFSLSVIVTVLVGFFETFLEQKEKRFEIQNHLRTDGRTDWHMMSKDWLKIVTTDLLMTIVKSEIPVQELHNEHN